MNPEMAISGSQVLASAFHRRYRSCLNEAALRALQWSCAHFVTALGTQPMQDAITASATMPREEKEDSVQKRERSKNQWRDPRPKSNEREHASLLSWFRGRHHDNRSSMHCSDEFSVVLVKQVQVWLEHKRVRRATELERALWQA
jgi:hypothetical protein